MSYGDIVYVTRLILESSQGLTEMQGLTEVQGLTEMQRLTEMHLPLPGLPTPAVVQA